MSTKIMCDFCKKIIGADMTYEVSMMYHEREPDHMCGNCYKLCRECNVRETIKA